MDSTAIYMLTETINKLSQEINRLELLVEDLGEEIEDLIEDKATLEKDMEKYKGFLKFVRIKSGMPRTLEMLDIICKESERIVYA